MGSENPLVRFLNAWAPGWLLVCPLSPLRAHPGDPLYLVLSLLPALSLPFLAFLNAPSLVGRGRAAGHRRSGCDLPLPRFRPLPAVPPASAQDAIRCKWKLQWMLPWPPAGVPGQCTQRLRGEGAGRGAGPQARGRCQTLAALSSSPLPPPPSAADTPLRPGPAPAPSLQRPSPRLLDPSPLHLPGALLLRAPSRALPPLPPPLPAAQARGLR